MSQRRKIKIAVLITIILLLIFRNRIFPFNSMEDFIDFIQNIDEIPYSSILFILVGIFSSLFFFPISWIKVAGGLFFGFSFGLIYNIVIVMLSALLSFTFSRYLFKDSIQVWLGKISKTNFNEKQLKILKITENPSFKQIFILRNIYFISFTFLNYTLGVSKTPLKIYLYSTFFAILPGTTVITYLFSQSIEVMDEPSKLIIPSIFMLIYYLILFFVNKKVQKDYSKLK